MILFLHIGASLSTLMMARVCNNTLAKNISRRGKILTISITEMKTSMTITSLMSNLILLASASTIICLKRWAIIRVKVAITSWTPCKMMILMSRTRFANLISSLMIKAFLTWSPKPGVNLSTLTFTIKCLSRKRTSIWTKSLRWRTNSLKKMKNAKIRWK